MEYLKNKDNHRIVSVWDEENSDRFSVGRIVASDEDYTVMETLTVDGNTNGLYMTCTESIFCIKENDRYTQSVKKLFEKRERAFEVFDLRSGTPLKVFLNYSKEKNRLISVKLCNEETITGRIIEIFDDSILIKAFDENGYDGEAEISTNSIVCWRCNSHYERNIEVLNQ